MFIGNFEQDMPSLNGTLGGEALQGLSAYDIAVKNGFEGTEQEWLESLKGKDGASKADEVSAVVPEGLPKETKPDVQSVLNELAAKPSGGAGQKTPEGGEIFNDYVDNVASATGAHAEGGDTTASGSASHSEGYFTTASGDYSHAEGYSTTASGDYGSHAEGYSTTASGNYSSHAEGYRTYASGDYSHAEGYSTTACGNYSSHAEGEGTTASGNYGSHAEGGDTTASGDYSHAEGYFTTASGDYSHAEGDSTTASGSASHSEGYFTTASSESQHVEGKFNIPDTDTKLPDGTPQNKYAHIVGNGTYNEPSNAHTIDWHGNSWYQGRVLVGGVDMDTPDSELTPNSLIIQASDDPSRRFKITVDSTGAIKAEEVIKA